LTLAFLPALYAIWFRVSDVDAVRCNHGQQAPQSNCFVANIPKCISIRSRSGCAKTAGTNADYVSKLRAIKMV